MHNPLRGTELFRKRINPEFARLWLGVYTIAHLASEETGVYDPAAKVVVEYADRSGTLYTASLELIQEPNETYSWPELRTCSTALPMQYDLFSVKNNIPTLRTIGDGPPVPLIGSSALHEYIRRVEHIGSIMRGERNLRHVEVVPPGQNG